MCGIIAYIQKTKTKNFQTNIGHLFASAYQNKHRGRADGLGIISVSNKGEKTMFKTVLEMDELNSGDMTNTPENKNRASKIH